MQNYALRGLNKMEINMLGEFVAKQFACAATAGWQIAESARWLNGSAPASVSKSYAALALYPTLSRPAGSN